MAKRRGTPGLRKALAGVNKIAGSMARELQGDYKVALSANNAGVRNLRNQLGRLERGGLKTMLDQQTALQYIKRDAGAQQSTIRGKAEAAGNRYGGAMSGAVGSAFGPATASGAAGARVAASKAVQGAAMTRTGQTVMALAREGTRAQKAAAEYALNRAAAMRGQADANTIAGITGQLYQTALSAEMAHDNWLKQMKLTRKWAKEDAEDATKFDWQGLQPFIDSAPGMANELGLILRNKASALYDPEATPGSAVEALVQKYGISDPAELQLLMLTARKIYSSDTTPDQALWAALDSAYGGKPGWEKHSTALQDVFQAGVRDAYNNYLKVNDLPVNPGTKPGESLVPNAVAGPGFMPVRGVPNTG